MMRVGEWIREMAVNKIGGPICLLVQCTILSASLFMISSLNSSLQLVSALGVGEQFEPNKAFGAMPVQTNQQVNYEPSMSVKISTSIAERVGQEWQDSVRGNKRSLVVGERREQRPENQVNQQQQLVGYPSSWQPIQFSSHEADKGQLPISGKIMSQPASQRSSISWNYASPQTQTASQQQPQPQQQQIQHYLLEQAGEQRDQASGQARSNSILSPRNELKQRCQGMSLGKMLVAAKNFLTNGFSSVMLEQRSSQGYLRFGSSLLAAAVPLAALVLPESRRRRAGNAQKTSAPEIENQASRFSLQARVDSVMGWIERSVEHLPNFPRLHPQECVKRSICEAHNEPNKYGAIGFILRLLFPATNLSVTDRMDDMEYKVINKYRHAAGFGLNKRIETNGTSSAACKEKYEDCLVSLLDVAQNLMDLFLK